MQQETFSDVSESIKEIMMGLVEFLNQHGIEQVPCDAVMRLLGVPSQDADVWNQHYLVIIDNVLDVVEIVDEDVESSDDLPKPTLH